MPLHPYSVILNGAATTLMLDEEEAERLGLTRPAEKAAPAPANKARSPRQNKQG